jgi:hypothetical protein
MRKWQITVIEPSLDDLLGDEIMTLVMRSAGINAEELRIQLRRAACRLARASGKKTGSDDCSRWAFA